MRLVTCAEVDFLITVDDGAFVRMFYLDDLQNRAPIKFTNVYPSAQDNSTWSCDGVNSTPPRVVVGSNAHTLSVIDLTSEQVCRFKAHKHNVPSCSFSPCGRFIASTSIDHSVKVWQLQSNSKWELIAGAIPDSDWGWAIRWANKNDCLPFYHQQKTTVKKSSKFAEV